VGTRLRIWMRETARSSHQGFILELLGCLGGDIVMLVEHAEEEGARVSGAVTGSLDLPPARVLLPTLGDAVPLDLPQCL
jgi:hypothetical protein